LEEPLEHVAPQQDAQPRMTSERIRVTDLAPGEIAVRLGLEPFQGRQIFHWIHARQVFDFRAMTDLAKDLRRRLAETTELPQIAALEKVESPASGTRKILFSLRDDETIEAVLLRDAGRTTLCLSTQVGCPLGCGFCATGRSGFTRNLSPGEIVEQALYLLRDEPEEGRTPNIVYMGMGEPFHNYEAVMRSIRLLMAKEGLAVGARKITVSTAGDAPGIERFAKENWQVRLSISLHAASDGLRSRLTPLNRKYPLARLLDAVRNYTASTGRRVTFEWVLIDGVNDALADAEALVRLVRGLNADVNIIPYNPVPEIEYRPPPPARIAAFQNALVQAGIKATLRQERGQDIRAACGQLRRQYARLRDRTTPNSHEQV